MQKITPLRLHQGATEQRPYSCKLLYAALCVAWRIQNRDKAGAEKLLKILIRNDLNATDVTISESEKQLIEKARDKTSFEHHRK